MTDEGLVATGRPTRHLTVGGSVTAEGHAYTVAQICTYRVVLTPEQAHLPTTTPSVGASALPAACLARTHTTGATVSKQPILVDGRWRLRWHIPNGIGDNTTVVFETMPDDQSAFRISAACGGQTVATYDNVREGDRIELGGRVWHVGHLETAYADLRPESAS